MDRMMVDGAAHPFPASTQPSHGLGFSLAFMLSSLKVPLSLARFERIRRLLAIMFPLKNASDGDFQHLCEILWDWQPCQECDAKMTCNYADCTARRKKRLGKFFAYFRNISQLYDPEVTVDQKPALSTHADLLNIIMELKRHPELTRSAFTATMFPRIMGEEPKIPTAEQQRAVDLAVRIFAMINCVADPQTATLLESGPHPRVWRGDVSFAEFVSGIYSISNHPLLNDIGSIPSMNMKNQINARNLRSRANLSFRPTDDIGSHLKLDDHVGIVYIFHHTAFLKEHLLVTRDLPATHSVVESLYHGALPRQLALEILDSIQKLLFPQADAKSYALLVSLTSSSKGSFDPDSLRFESGSIRRPEEKDIAYYYLGERLMDLYSELQDPKPRGGLAKWLERRSHPRYVMLATLIGVMIAVLLGLAGLAVTTFQTWITYQAWKHPVQE